MGRKHKAELEEEEWMFTCNTTMLRNVHQAELMTMGESRIHVRALMSEDCQAATRQFHTSSPLGGETGSLESVGKESKASKTTQVLLNMLHNLHC